MRVLVIEDDQALASACVRVLVANGHSSRYADSVIGAEIAISEFNPDVIVLDLMLDDSRDPCHTMDAVKAQIDTRAVPIIVFSAFPFDSEECVKNGCSEFLLKGSFTPMDLPAAVNRAVNRHKLIVALERREAMRRGDLSWPGGAVEPDKVGERMISLAKEIRAMAS